MSNITLKVNGATHTVDIDPSTPLLYILRNDLGLQGPSFGCGLGQCGACTVLINGAAVRSCILPASSVKGEITTLEGLSPNGRLHPLQQAWIDEQVPQCGFCQNGQIMTAKAMLDKNPHPTDAQIRRVHERNVVPLHDVLPDSGRHQTRGQSDRRCPARHRERRLRHDCFQRNSQTGRRSPDHPSQRLLKSAGLLLVGFAAPNTRAQAAEPRRSLSRSRFPATRLVDRHS